MQQQPACFQESVGRSRTQFALPGGLSVACFLINARLQAIPRDWGSVSKPANEVMF